MSQYGPAGDSPYGCVDMAGNVLEWTSSLHGPYPHDADDGREDPEAEGTRVLRGGFWYSLQAYVRSTYRFGNRPVSWLDLTRFPCAVCTPSLSP